MPALDPAPRAAWRRVAVRTCAVAGVVLLTAAKAAPSPQVEAAWSRPVTQGATAVGFMTLVNPTAKADSLVAVTSPLSPMVMIHESTMTNGIASMRMLDRVDLPAKGRVALTPGGKHLMFQGVTRTLKVGAKLPAKLRFASGRTLDINFTVGLATPSR